MPALVLFGRRSRVGSDDLYIPALLVVLYQIPIIFVCVFYTTIWRGCSSVEFNLQGFPFWFMLGAIPIVGFMTCLHIIIMHISTKGSIIEHERRVLMPRVINIHFLWSIVFLTYGTIGVYFWCHGDLCIPDSRFVLVK
jgi:hypothetical protein